MGFLLCLKSPQLQCKHGFSFFFGQTAGTKPVRNAVVHIIDSLNGLIADSICDKPLHHQIVIADMIVEPVLEFVKGRISQLPDAVPVRSAGIDMGHAVRLYFQKRKRCAAVVPRGIGKLAGIVILMIVCQGGLCSGN